MTNEARMSMKTKEKTTHYPTNKATFLHNETIFHAKAYVFCQNRRFLYRFSSTGERVLHFKTDKLDPSPLARKRHILKFLITGAG